MAWRCFSKCCCGRLLFSLIAWLLWRYRDWLSAFAGRMRLPQRQQQPPPQQLFGLEVAPQSLPADIPGEVERLWDDQPRAALGLLYRALLSRMLHEQRLPLNSAHTEAEVLQLVQALAAKRPQSLQPGPDRPLAEPRLRPSAAASQRSNRGLCSAWRQLFEQEAQA